MKLIKLLQNLVSANLFNNIGIFFNLQINPLSVGVYLSFKL